MYNIFDIKYNIQMNILSSQKLNQYIVIVKVQLIEYFSAFKHTLLILNIQ